MLTRFCASCGTEVDETAVFCPTCGQPIDQEAESAMPPAPAWPDPEPDAIAVRRESFAPDAEREPAPADEAEEPEPVAAGSPPRVDPAFDDDQPDAEVTRVEERPARPADEPQPAPAVSAPPAGPPRSTAPSPRPAMDLPITTPVTMSGWLIGGGAAIAAIGALLALFDGLGTAIDVILLVGLVGIAASVFLSDRLPTVPHLRLATLAVVLIAFGVGLDRLGFGRAGAGELLLFLGTAAAAIGAILLETGRDQPLGGPSA